MSNETSAPSKPREWYIFTLPGSERLYANELDSIYPANTIPVIEKSAFTEVSNRLELERINVKALQKNCDTLAADLEAVKIAAEQIRRERDEAIRLLNALEKRLDDSRTGFLRLERVLAEANANTEFARLNHEAAERAVSRLACALAYAKKTIHERSDGYELTDARAEIERLERGE